MLSIIPSVLQPCIFCNCELLIYTFNNLLKQNLDLLLQKIHLVTATHQHTEVLEMCAKILEFICSKINPTLTIRCNAYKSSIIDTITNKHREIVDDWDNLIEEVNS